jgi:acetyl-CoA carboxylase carboxyltransferase component
MDERALKLAPGLLVSVGERGEARVWQPRRAELTTMDADLLALLLNFADGRTVAEAAEAAGLEADESVLHAAQRFTEAGLLAPCGELPAPSGNVARARIAELVDPGTFVETAGGPIVTGVASVAGRRIALAAWEPPAYGGIEDLLALQERVAAEPCPIVYLFDRFSIGHDPAQFASARAIGRVYANQGRLSGQVPQIGVVCGALWRPAALLPALCDAVVMIEQEAFVHLGDVDAVKRFTGEQVTAEALGGTRMHAEQSGLAHLVARSTAEAAALVRRYLGFMPSSHPGWPPTAPPAPPPASAPGMLDHLVPEEGDRPFPMLELVEALVDGGTWLELRADYARELATGVARLDGIAVGVIANRSEHKGGVLTVEAAEKAARFVTLCDTNGLALLFFIDVPGFAIGRAAERAGIERAAGRLFAALATTAVPRLALVVRKAHTAGLYAMCGPPFDPDAFLALPTGSISIFSERAATHALEGKLDEEQLVGLRGYRRALRGRPDALVDKVVSASEAREELIPRLHAALERARLRARPRRVIPC